MKKKLFFAMVICSLALSGCSTIKVAQKVLQEVETVVENEDGVAEKSPTEESIIEETSAETIEENISEELIEETKMPEETEGELAETSYVAEDGSIVRMSYEYLVQMEDAVMQIITALPEEMPTSDLTQEDLDEATVQWFNTTYAVMMYQNHFDSHYIGGIFQGSQFMVSILENDWGVTDRASAIDNIIWLISEGHRTSYEESVEELEEIGILELSLEEYLGIWEAYALESEMDFESIRPYFTNIYTAYHQCGEAGVKAWDYCRVMQMCGSYYAAGYFSLEETMEISLAMAQLLRAEYVSWEDMMNSYICGYDYWRAEDPNVEGNGSYWRHYYYNELKNMEGNPYSTYPWDTEFVVNWR